MPFTAMGIYYPSSVDPPNGPTQMQALATNVDTLLDLPDDVAGFVNSTIAVTATSFATLPSPGPLAISITNPSSVYNLEIDVTFSAWMTVGATTTSVTAGIQGSGGMTWAAAGFGSGGPIANSDNLFTNSAQFVQQAGHFPVIIPAGAAALTLTMHAFRSNTGASAAVNYPTLRAKPRRFIVP